MTAPDVPPRIAAQLDQLFPAGGHALRPALARWMAASRRFAAFCEANQPKLRKKLRVATDPEAIDALALECETAALLLREKSLSPAWEPALAEPGRSADFAVDYTSSLRFMLEVTRLHGATPTDAARERERFIDALAGKLGQLSAGCPNVIVLATESAGVDVGEALRVMQQRAERADAGHAQRFGCASRAALIAQQQRLSAVLLRAAPLGASRCARLFANPQARHPLPARVVTALLRAHAD